jgi:hypothetical protein
MPTDEPATNSTGRGKVYFFVDMLLFNLLIGSRRPLIATRTRVRVPGPTSLPLKHFAFARFVLDTLRLAAGSFIGVRISLFSMIILSLLAAPLLAQQSYREFERDLNLSPQQRSHVDNVKKRYINEWRALKDQSVQRRIELGEMNRARPGRRERAEQLERELDQIEATRHQLYRQYRGEVSTVFTNEQRERYDRFCEKEKRRPIGPPRYRAYGR